MEYSPQTLRAFWFMNRVKDLQTAIFSQIDKPREECGVFGIYFKHPKFSRHLVQATLSGLLTNQHRGEESAGIAVSNGKRVSEPFRKMGLVHDLFQAYHSNHSAINSLSGYMAIAHTRYSTTGSSSIKNAAPFLFSSRWMGTIAIAHNGNITNAESLRKEIGNHKFSSSTDSEIIGALIVHSKGASWDEKIINALNKLEGSFSLLLLTKDSLYGVRDPIGNRPLSYADFERDGTVGFALSSESPAFDRLEIRYQREIKPGELIKFSKKGKDSIQFAKNTTQAFCGLEIAYLMRPDSRLEKTQLDTIRRYLGAKLARIHLAPKKVDFVTYIPESARSTAEGFAEETSKILKRPIFARTSLLKGRYGTINGVIRGFINPNKGLRNEVAQANFFTFDWLSGKRIVLVDDSIIRGTTTGGVINTMRHKVGFLRAHGAEEVHLRIIFPQVIGPCPLGTDISNEDRLIASELTNLEEIADYLKVESLEFLTPKEFTQGVSNCLGREFGLCLGCTTGNYPITNFKANKDIFERKESTRKGRS